MKKLSILVLLILSNLIVLSQSNLDTTRTYNYTDLKAIAFKLAQADERDSILVITERQLSNEIKIVTDKNNQILDLNGTIRENNDILNLKDKELKQVQLNLKNTTKALNWTRAGWASSVVGLLVVFIIVK